MFDTNPDLHFCIIKWGSLTQCLTKKLGNKSTFSVRDQPPRTGPPRKLSPHLIHDLLFPHFQPIQRSLLFRTRPPTAPAHPTSAHPKGQSPNTRATPPHTTVLSLIQPVNPTETLHIFDLLFPTLPIPNFLAGTSPPLFICTKSIHPTLSHDQNLII